MRIFIFQIFLKQLLPFLVNTIVQTPQVQNKMWEYSFLMNIKRKCYDSFYPFQILSRHSLRMLDFEPVTVLYGGNGSGKTTALNVIAEKLGLRRDTAYNRSNFFEDGQNLKGVKRIIAFSFNVHQKAVLPLNVGKRKMGQPPEIYGISAVCIYKAAGGRHHRRICGDKAGGRAREGQH